MKNTNFIALLKVRIFFALLSLLLSTLFFIFSYHLCDFTEEIFSIKNLFAMIPGIGSLGFLIRLIFILAEVQDCFEDIANPRY